MSTGILPPVQRRSTVVVEGFGFLEGLRWHEGRLWASDIACRRVLAIDFSSTQPNVETIIELDDQPSGLGWMPDGSLLVVAMRSKKLLRVLASDLGGRGPRPAVLHADLSGFVHDDLNDMVVDRDGRAYVTNFGYDPATSDPVPTGVLVVEPDGRAAMTAAELFRPNGCAITEDGATFVVAETRAHRLTAYRRATDGGLSAKRSFAVTPSPSWCDGICLDATGGVWVSDPKGRQTIRVEDDGRITDRVDVAPRQSIACALGGPARRTLYFSTCTIKPWEVMARELDCRIESVEVDHPGAGLP